MTGVEHYLEAERLEAAVDDAETDTAAVLLIGRAGLHATLALAAATALAAESSDGMHRADFTAWDKVCGVPPRPMGAPV